MKLTWKVFAALTGIFLAGTVTGGFLGARVTRVWFDKRGPEQFGPQQVKRFTEQLSLTEKQSERIRPIVAQAADELRKARRDAFRTSSAIVEQMEAAIAKELTPEQVKRLAEIQIRESERRKQWMAERAKRGEGRPPGGPDGAQPGRPEGGPALPPPERP